MTPTDFYLTAVQPAPGGLLAESLKPIRQCYLTVLGVEPAAGTITRHTTTGIPLPGGTAAVLEAVRVGSKLFTSEAAVRRFVVAQQVGHAGPVADEVRSPAGRNLAAVAAGNQLAAMGC